MFVEYLEGYEYNEIVGQPRHRRNCPIAQYLNLRTSKPITVEPNLITEFSFAEDNPVVLAKNCQIPVWVKQFTKQVDALLDRDNFFATTVLQRQAMYIAKPLLLFDYVFWVLPTVALNQNWCVHQETHIARVVYDYTVLGHWQKIVPKPFYTHLNEHQLDRAIALCHILASSTNSAALISELNCQSLQYRKSPKSLL